jgi:hypothetical protein
VIKRPRAKKRKRRSRAKRRKRRSRAKRRKKRRRLPILMETIVTKEVCERKVNLELEILNQGEY